MCRVHIESLTGAEVDTSGKDISRGFYLSYDPNAYLNLELLAKIEPIQAHIAAPDKLEKKSKNRQRESTMTNTTGIQVEPWVKQEFEHAVDSTRKKGAFKGGNLVNFMSGLVLACFCTKIHFATAISIAPLRY